MIGLGLSLWRRGGSAAYSTRLTGGAVVSWSRWFYDNRQYRIPRFFDRLLNHFEEGHGRSAGPPLWGTQDCSPLFRCAAVALVLLGVLA